MLCHPFWGLPCKTAKNQLVSGQELSGCSEVLCGAAQLKQFIAQNIVRRIHFPIPARPLEKGARLWLATAIFK